ncbi:MAG: Aminodeoxychorismate lyase [Parcubacteria group bacterium GW2011_GWA2_47_16]|nr:MAG: Aminodeoxychorismate lyase [Parcubacteria group bacterium GW2011_GWA2_47_16]
MPPTDSNIPSNFFDGKFKDRRTFFLWCLAVFSILILLFTFYTVSFKPPASFPVRKVITIKEKTGLNEIAGQLFALKVVRSPFWFRTFVILKSGQGGVLAGDYYFDTPLVVSGVASRMTRGNFGLTATRVTLPEGMTAAQMGVVLAGALVDFDSEEFLELAKEKEGYLFPDTYLFLPNTKSSQIIATLKDNFDKKIEGIDESIKSFGKPLKDVVVMASILEAEARTTETRRTIAGILWKRLDMGMPLQVDAPFQYIIGKNTFQLTLNDLKYDSPYNTYKYKGLPPGAIGNPGLDSLIAAVTPIKSPYLFYLSDIRGNMHYAKTFEEHVANKERYLK